MIPALWISKTGLDAQETNISVTSNNLANASTVGFKRGRAVFEDLYTKRSISLVADHQLIAIYLKV